MKLHHIGYAVHKIKESIDSFMLMGFEPCGEIVDDDIRKVKICFMKNGDSLVELIAPLNEKSPVSQWLNKNGCSPYHLCYESYNINEDIKYLKDNGAKEISRPLEAPAINGNLVAFLYLSTVGIIELVEDKS